MIDIKYVQRRLDQMKSDDYLPMRSWCRDLITEVRKLETAAHYTDNAIQGFKSKIEELENDLKWSGSINQEREDQYCHASLGDGECSWSECPQIRDGEPMNTARDCPLDIHDEDE